MNYCLVQLILAARSRDGGGWMQILVFVLIAIFYGVSYVIKSKTGKFEEQQQDKSESGRRPAQRPQPGAQRPASRTVQIQPRRSIHPPRRKVARPQPVVQKINAEVEQLQLQPAPEPLGLKKQQELLVKRFEDMKGLEAGTLEGVQPAVITGEPLLDFNDPEMLRRAILHYEILGKPLSLRGPGEHTVG